MTIEATGKKYYEKIEIKLADLKSETTLSGINQVNYLKRQYTVNFECQSFKHDYLKFAVTPNRETLQRLAADQYAVSLDVDVHRPSWFELDFEKKPYRSFFMAIIGILPLLAPISHYFFIALFFGVLLIWRIRKYIQYIRHRDSA